MRHSLEKLNVRPIACMLRHCVSLLVVEGDDCLHFEVHAWVGLIVCVCVCVCVSIFSIFLLLFLGS